MSTKQTKIMVYKNGDRVSRHGQWSLNNTWLIVVNAFSYVSVTFTKQLSLSSMAQSQCLKAKRALTILLNSLYRYGVLSHSMYFKMFDTKIKPILVYGSELWGILEHNCVEVVHRYGCKRFLCVGQNVSNLAILAECGLVPIYIETQIRCVKYWLKVLKNATK